MHKLLSFLKSLACTQIKIDESHPRLLKDKNLDQTFPDSRSSSSDENSTIFETGIIGKSTHSMNP